MHRSSVSVSNADATLEQGVREERNRDKCEADNACGAKAEETATGREDDASGNGGDAETHILREPAGHADS